MYVYQPQDHNIVRWVFDQLLKNWLVNVLKFLSLSDSIIVIIILFIIILFLCFRILSIDYFEKAYKTCSILSWGAVPLKIVWKSVRKVPDLRHSRL